MGLAEAGGKGEYGAPSTRTPPPRVTLAAPWAALREGLAIHWSQDGPLIPLGQAEGRQEGGRLQVDVSEQGGEGRELAPPRPPPPALTSIRLSCAVFFITEPELPGLRFQGVMGVLRNVRTGGSREPQIQSWRPWQRRPWGAGLPQP